MDPLHRRARAGQPARTNLQQHGTNTGYSLEDRPEEMDDKDERRDKVREIRASGTT